jgi:hypothetical protein
MHMTMSSTELKQILISSKFDDQIKNNKYSHTGNHLESINLNLYKLNTEVRG